MNALHHFLHPMRWSTLARRIFVLTLPISGPAWGVLAFFGIFTVPIIVGLWQGE